MLTECSFSALGSSRLCRSGASISSACNNGSRRSAKWTAQRRRRKSRFDARAPAARVLRMLGDGISARGHRRLRHHGAKTCGRQRDCAPLQYAPDRRDPRRLDPGIRSAFEYPAVSVAFALRGELAWSTAVVYIVVQVLGGLVGVWVAHLMFELPVWQFSITERTGRGQWLAEAVATFGLVLTVLGCASQRPDSVPYAVGLYITAAYSFHFVR